MLKRLPCHAATAFRSASSPAPALLWPCACFLDFERRNMPHSHICDFSDNGPSRLLSRASLSSTTCFNGLVLLILVYTSNIFIQVGGEICSARIS